MLRILAEEGKRSREGQLLMEMDDTGYVEKWSALTQPGAAIKQLEDALEAPSASDRPGPRSLAHRHGWRQNAQEDYDKIADRPDVESSDKAMELERAKLEYELADASSSG